MKIVSFCVKDDDFEWIENTRGREPRARYLGRLFEDKVKSEKKKAARQKAN